MGHEGVGWGVSCRGGVGWVGHEGVRWGGVGHVGVGWGGSKLKTQKIITHRVLKIHKWISGDVYEWGKVSLAMTSDK